MRAADISAAFKLPNGNLNDFIAKFFGIEPTNEREITRAIAIGRAPAVEICADDLAGAE